MIAQLCGECALTCCLLLGRTVGGASWCRVCSQQAVTAQLCGVDARALAAQLVVAMCGEVCVGKRGVTLMDLQLLRVPTAGVTDIHLLFTIAALMASCMLFGWQMEVRGGMLWSRSGRGGRFRHG